MGGSLESDEGSILGTIFIINVENREAAVSFTDQEPYHKAGVLESVLVRRWRQMQPELTSGENAHSAEKATEQLKREGLQS